VQDLLSFVRLERRASTGFAIRFGRVRMRLPLRIPNASSLVDFLSKVTLLRFSFLSLSRVGFFSLTASQRGDFPLFHFQWGDISSYFFLFFLGKEKKEVSKKEKKARSSGIIALTLRHCSFKTLVGFWL